jgi:hypothetical protein
MKSYTPQVSVHQYFKVGWHLFRRAPFPVDQRLQLAGTFSGTFSARSGSFPEGSFPPSLPLARGALTQAWREAA